jgi:hypothetical protein
LHLFGLQVELLNWLFSIRNNHVTQDDEEIRAFLLLPTSLAIEESVSGKYFSSSYYTESIKTKYNLILDDNHPFYTMDRKLAPEGVAVVSSAPSSPVAGGKGAGRRVSHADNSAETAVVTKNYRGNRIDEFQFLDIPKIIANMSEDAKFTHNFQVRGLNYLNDKKKISGGFALMKLITMELYKVKNPTKERDRYDHIAAHPKIQARIATLMAALDEEKPFIYVVNIQIPGNPPVNCVFYFAVPYYFHKDCEPGSDGSPADPVKQKAKKMWERFIDIPFTNGSVSASASGNSSPMTSGKFPPPVVPSNNNNNSADSSRDPSPIPKRSSEIKAAAAAALAESEGPAPFLS